jgi:hypothetical protein
MPRNPRFRVHFYYPVEASLSCLIKTLRTSHQAVWLGLLDRDELCQLTKNQYQRWGKYRDASYNQSDLSLWEELAIERYFDGCRSLLVASSGGGREVLALVRSGFHVQAFECCGPLAEWSRRLLGANGFDTPVLDSLPDEVPQDLGILGGAIVGWGAYMHIQGCDRRIRFLKGIAGHLRPGSPVLLSFFERAGDPRSMRWIAKIANAIRRMRFSRERVEIGDTLVDTFDHHFTRQEVQSELEAAGFDLELYQSTPYAHAVGRLKTAQG